MKHEERLHLRNLARGADINNMSAFHEAANPAVVIGLLDANEGLIKALTSALNEAEDAGPKALKYVEQELRSALEKYNGL